MAETLKVSSRSTPQAVAGALACLARSGDRVEIQVVGAGALNQAIKALAIARGYVAPSGLDLSCRPGFTDIEIDGESRTAIRLVVECDAPPRMPAGLDGTGTTPFVQAPPGEVGMLTGAEPGGGALRS